MTATTPTAGIDTLLADRWSCRQFIPDRPVPRPAIDTLLTLAGRTPSWSNTQPWQVWVTTAPATARLRQALTDHITVGGPVKPDIDFPVTYTGDYRQRRRDCGYALYASLDIARDDHAARSRQFLRNFEFFDAPHVAIITSPTELGTYGALDCGLYINTFLLAAQAQGLAAAPQAALAAYSPFLHDYFPIDNSRTILAGICFGYPDLDHPVNQFRTTRAPLGENITIVE